MHKQKLVYTVEAKVNTIIERLEEHEKYTMNKEERKFGKNNKTFYVGREKTMITCYKCQKKDHIAHTCPENKIFTLMERQEMSCRIVKDDVSINDLP